MFQKKNKNKTKQNRKIWKCGQSNKEMKFQ